MNAYLKWSCLVAGGIVVLGCVFLLGVHLTRQEMRLQTQDAVDFVNAMTIEIIQQCPNHEAVFAALEEEGW